MDVPLRFQGELRFLFLNGTIYLSKHCSMQFVNSPRKSINVLVKKRYFNFDFVKLDMREESIKKE